MREAAGEQQQEPVAGEAGSSVCAEPAGSGHCGQPWKKFVYVEPPKRVKEVLEEELYFRRDGCQIKHPAAGCFFPAQWAIADLAKFPMNARAVSRSGSGRSMECEKKFLHERLDTSITKQKQFTFTAQVLFQARRNKKIAPMKSNISLSGGCGSGQAPPRVTKPTIILFQQTQSTTI